MSAETFAVSVRQVPKLRFVLDGVIVVVVPIWVIVRLVGLVLDAEA